MRPVHLMSQMQRVILLGGGGYLLLVLLVAVFQRRLLYQPSHEPSESLGSSSGLTPWTENGRFLGWAREVERPTELWLMFHGNAGQAAHRDYAVPSIPETVSFFILEYPGYGARDGSPSLDSINRAAVEAYEALRKRSPELPISVVGESLGSGPASFLATRPKPPERIVLIVPYDALANVASAHFSWLPAGLLLRDRWDNRESLRSFKGRLDVFVAREDEVIPAEFGRQLAQSVPGAHLHEIPGGHNDWSIGEKIRLKVESR